MISAVILTESNQKNLSKCLDSVAWCDERIILTNDHITDFAAQRNAGLAKAKSDWVLFVDTDETVTDDLAREIQTKTKHTDCQGFYLKREDFFLGRQLRFGETSRVRLLRLARKGAGQWQRRVHEVWHVNGKTATLIHPLRHYSHPTIREFITTMNNYTDLETGNFNPLRVFVNPMGKFLQNYIFRLGFLDGFPGFVMAYIMSLQSLITRVKQYEIIAAKS